MKHVLRFLLAITLALTAIFLLFKFPIHSLISLAAVIAVVGLYDVLQKEHTSLRNFPILGHFRYLLDSIGPEIRQYFVEADTDRKPLNRYQRTYIYARAKQDNSAHPFGTEHRSEERRVGKECRSRWASDQ